MTGASPHSVLSFRLIGATPSLGKAGLAVCKGPGHLGVMQGQREVFKGRTAPPGLPGEGSSPSAGLGPAAGRFLPTACPAVLKGGSVRSKGGALPGRKVSQQAGWVRGGGRSGQERVQRKKTESTFIHHLCCPSVEKTLGHTPTHPCVAVAALSGTHGRHLPFPGG